MVTAPWILRGLYNDPACFGIFIPLRLLGSFFHIAMNGMSASDKIFRILDMEEEADGTQSLTDGPISADLRHVAFPTTWKTCTA